MQPLRLKDTDGNGFRPPCFSALSEYSGPLYHNQYDLPSPQGIVNHSWTQVVRAFDRMLDTLQTSAALKKAAADRDKHIKDLLAAYEALLYQAMEFIEDIERNISKCLSPDSKHPVDISGPGTLRKLIAVPCNKLKHNHNRLAFVAATGLLFSASGFAIYRIKNGTLEPNPEIHKDRRAFSFNVELRRLLATLYFYADGAATKIRALSQGQASPTRSSVTDPSTLAILGRLARLPISTFPFEKQKHMPSIEVNEHQVTISFSGGAILPASGNFTMMAQFEGDGATRSFTVP